MLDTVNLSRSRKKNRYIDNIGVMNSIIFGTGEYVTGWTGASGSISDKALGVVALVHFDLRQRGLIGPEVVLCGTNGTKKPQIAKHFADNIGKTFKNFGD